jgi:uncharacterized membrane protein YqgA involved in biofilm formation
LNPIDALFGTLVNTATVLLGGALGMAAGARLPSRMQQTLMQAVGLVTLFIGFSMAQDLTRVGGAQGVILGLMALALGALLGEWWRLAERLEALGDWLKGRVRGQGRFTEGWVSATLLFCVGPMTLVGSLQGGLLNDHALLLLKATLDGISALALAAALGVGVLFSAASVLLLQGAIALAAQQVAAWLPNPATNPMVLLVSGVGGLLVVGLGLMLLDIKRVPVANLLPALPLVAILYAVARPLL